MMISEKVYDIHVHFILEGEGDQCSKAQLSWKILLSFLSLNSKQPIAMRLLRKVWRVSKIKIGDHGLLIFLSPEYISKQLRLAYKW